MGNRAGLTSLFSYAMIASERIDDIARFTGASQVCWRRNRELTPQCAAGANVVWRCVLLGGLYDSTNAPQGKDGSAMDVPMPDCKKKLLAADFQREITRYALPLKFHPQHPLKSVDGELPAGRAGRSSCGVFLDVLTEPC